MKKSSASLPIKEMQIKMTLRFYLTQDRLAIIQKTTNIGKDVICVLGENPYTLYVRINAVTMEISMEVPQETKNRTAI
jgi:hypothetical protein